MRNKPLRRQYRAADVGTEGKKMKSAAAIKRRLPVPNYARETIENRAAVAAETSPGTRSRSDVTSQQKAIGLISSRTGNCFEFYCGRLRRQTEVTLTKT